ncbi:MAG: DUF2793 domain-containing protein [Pseudomonadota bacterium]
MPDQTPNLSLPFIMPAQAQKHVTHNEAIELLDMIVQLTLQATDVMTPPGSANEGEAWAVGTGATGDWAGQDGMIATWRGGGWLFVAPRDGWLAWVRSVEDLLVFTGGTWIAQAGELQNLTSVGINASADATNRLSVNADATLLKHDSAGHQVKVNKAAAGDTGSLLYQTAFSGRAEMGLAGDDDFSVKVSADGITWFTALTATGADGHVQIDQVLRLAPSATPASPTAGEIYFDDTTSVLRCFDGAAWQDLF